MNRVFRYIEIQLTSEAEMIQKKKGHGGTIWSFCFLNSRSVITIPERKYNLFKLYKLFFPTVSKILGFTILTKW